MSSPKRPTSKPDQPGPSQEPMPSRPAATPGVRQLGDPALTPPIAQATGLSQGTQAAMAGNHAAQVLAPPLPGSDPAQAIAIAWSDNAAFPSIAAKGRALIEAGLDTKVCTLGWMDRGETHDRLGQEAAFYAFVAAYGSPATRRQVATALTNDWTSDRDRWHSEGGRTAFAFKVKAHALNTDPEQETLLNKLGLSNDEVWERVRDNVWEGWRNDLANIATTTDPSVVQTELYSEGRSSGWAVPAMKWDNVGNPRPFSLEGMREEFDELEDSEIADEDAIRNRSYVFVLAQFERVIDEIMVNPQAAWDAEVQGLVEEQVEQVKEEEPKLLRQYALLQPLASDPEAGTQADRARLTAIQNKLEAAFGPDEARKKLHLPEMDRTTLRPFRVGERVTINLQAVRNSNRSIKAFPDDSFVKQLQEAIEAVGKPIGTVTHTFPPGYHLTVEVGGKAFHMEGHAWCHPISPEARG